MYISLIGVVIKNNSLLMVKKSDPDGKMKYILPGGHWDFPELFVDGAKREVYEETGVKTSGGKLVKIAHNRIRKRIEFYFLLKYESSDTNLIPIEKAEEDNEVFIPEFINISRLHDIRIKTKGMKQIAENISNYLIKEYL